MSERKNYPGKSKLPIAEELAGASWWPMPDLDHGYQLSRFEPVGLDQMTGVALLDRVETKFVFHERQLDSFLDSLIDSYRILEIDENRLNHYRTLYFDTSDFALFRRHHAGRRDRYKVRSRSYVDSDLSFLEVKHKVKRNRTIKNRVKTADFVDHLSPRLSGFLDDYLPPNSWQLQPRLWNEYTRITLVGLDNPERVTIDLNLQFRGEEQTMILPGVVIAEVKRGGHDHTSAFIRLMMADHIRPTGFSKYCVGVSMLYPEVKHNRFQSKLRMINKLIRQEEYYV